MVYWGSYLCAGKHRGLEPINRSFLQAGAELQGSMVKTDLEELSSSAIQFSMASRDAFATSVLLAERIEQFLCACKSYTHKLARRARLARRYRVALSMRGRCAYTSRTYSCRLGLRGSTQPPLASECCAAQRILQLNDHRIGDAIG
jgi:hypothetical protein